MFIIDFSLLHSDEIVYVCMNMLKVKMSSIVTNMMGAQFSLLDS